MIGQDPGFPLPVMPNLLLCMSIISRATPQPSPIGSMLYPALRSTTLKSCCTQVLGSLLRHDPGCRIPAINPVGSALRQSRLLFILCLGCGSALSYKSPVSPWCQGWPRRVAQEGTATRLELQGRTGDGGGGGGSMLRNADR